MVFLFQNLAPQERGATELNAFCPRGARDAKGNTVPVGSACWLCLQRLRGQAGVVFGRASKACAAKLLLAVLVCTTADFGLQLNHQTNLFLSSFDLGWLAVKNSR